MQFVNNRFVLHSRTAFEDHAEPDRRRHLVRLWLKYGGGIETAAATGGAAGRGHGARAASRDERGTRAFRQAVLVLPRADGQGRPRTRSHHRPMEARRLGRRSGAQHHQGNRRHRDARVSPAGSRCPRPGLFPALRRGHGGRAGGGRSRSRAASSSPRAAAGAICSAAAAAFSVPT